MQPKVYWCICFFPWHLSWIVCWLPHKIDSKMFVNSNRWSANQLVSQWSQECSLHWQPNHPLDVGVSWHKKETEFLTSAVGQLFVLTFPVDHYFYRPTWSKFQPIKPKRLAVTGQECHLCDVLLCALPLKNCIREFFEEIEDNFCKKHHSLWLDHSQTGSTGCVKFLWRVSEMPFLISSVFLGDFPGVKGHGVLGTGHS